MRKFALAVLLIVLCVGSTAAVAAENDIYTMITRWFDQSRSDHVTSNSSAENVGDPNEFEGQIFYIRKASKTGTKALHRYFQQQQSTSDHMDSTASSEPGYTKEHRQGYIFSSQKTGMSPVKRWYRASILDHLLSFLGETPSGYVNQGTLGYAYQRHGKFCEILASVSSGGVTMKTNGVAGGAVAELRWNGMQFINNHDYGRQIQIAVNFTSTGEVDNPTEAGSSFGCGGNNTPEGRAQGSPLLWSKHTSKNIETVTAPLQWNPGNFGGDADNPVIYQGTFSKKIEVNYDTSNKNRIRWTTTVDFYKARGYMDIEFITAYLRGNFKRYYAWWRDPSSGQVSYPEKFPGNFSGNCIDGNQANQGDLKKPVGGVVIATNNGSHALGFYSSKSDKRFALCDSRSGGGTGKYSAGTSKMSVLRSNPSSGISKGMKTYKAYLVVGTKAEVGAEMEQMAIQGL